MVKILIFAPLCHISIMATSRCSGIITNRFTGLKYLRSNVCSIGIEAEYRDSDIYEVRRRRRTLYISGTRFFQAILASPLCSEGSITPRKNASEGQASHMKSRKIDLWVGQHDLGGQL